MAQNKTGKYFKYAIGEIVLVVIGILIALSINNWNENRKEKLNESKILQTLNEEFIENKTTLDATMVELYHTQENLSFVLTNIDKVPKINLTATQLDSVLYFTSGNPYWKKSEYTLKNLENTGKLSNLSNQELKIRLYDYTLAIKDIDDKDQDANKAFIHLLNFYKTNGSLRNMDATGVDITEGRSRLDYNHLNFFKDLEFENAIDDYLVFTRQRIKKFLVARTIIDDIINMTSKMYD